jgi:hypothetical protein
LLASLRVLRWVGIIPLPAVDAAVMHVDLLAVYLIAAIGLMVGLSFRYLGEVYR